MTFMEQGLNIKKGFRSEFEMSCCFQQFLHRNIRLKVEVLKELNGFFGIPDYVISEPIEGTNDFYVVAIELKLSNWKKAMIQAFRYRNFANKSFVILDERYVHRAIKNQLLFQQYNIGLASFNIKEELRIHFLPSHNIPYSLKDIKSLNSKLVELGRIKYPFSDSRQSVSALF